MPIEQLEKTLDELIDRLSRKPPLPLKFMKKALIRAMDGGFEEMLLQEAVDAAVIHYSKKERVD